MSQLNSLSAVQQTCIILQMIWILRESLKILKTTDTAARKTQTTTPTKNTVWSL